MTVLDHTSAGPARAGHEPDGVELLDEELEHVVGGLNRVWIAEFADSGGAIEPRLRLAPRGWAGPLPVTALAES
jgi:hypothetical protein